MPLKDKHIFVVEDNVANRALVSIYLTQAGAAITFDRWGTETIAKLRKLGHVDAILMDLMLPGGVTGYQVFEQIRALPEFADVPIVAVTAADPTLEMPKVREKGSTGYIGKPIFPDFAQHVEDVLNGKPVWLAGQRGYS